MNLSFSTRGWSDLTWDEMISSALDMGFGGIEVYNLPKFDPLLEKGGPFHKYQTAATVRQLKEKKLKIPCFDTSYDLSESADCIPSLTELIDIAHNTQVPYVVCCALRDEEPRVFDRLNILVPYCQQKNVVLLLKSSGIYANTARLRSVLDHYASDYLAALWDVHHTYRDFGETGDTTIKNLGSYVCHVH